MITGDNGMTDEELREKVRDVSIFSRMVTEHKMRIVKAFRENGEIVAMTGDGVNDAPALKYADIGIAMGRRGSEVSREAGDLILLDDNFSTIVATIRDGRKIYDNIKKAVGYVFAIHIPVAFASLLAPMLGIDPAGLMLLPIHVVLLELIIDPTSSIVLERQPAERDLMERAPRDPSEKILSAGGLAKSLLQGIAVFAASFGTYLTVLPQSPQSGAPIARAMGLAVIFLSNILLVQVNSPNSDFVFQSVKRSYEGPCHMGGHCRNRRGPAPYSVHADFRFFETGAADRRAIPDGYRDFPSPRSVTATSTARRSSPFLSRRIYCFFQAGPEYHGTGRSACEPVCSHPFFVSSFGARIFRIS